MQEEKRNTQPSQVEMSPQSHLKPELPASHDLDNYTGPFLFRPGFDIYMYVDRMQGFKKSGTQWSVTTGEDFEEYLKGDEGSKKNQWTWNYKRELLMLSPWLTHKIKTCGGEGDGRKKKWFRFFKERKIKCFKTVPGEPSA